ncbi:MAG: BamA/OMP85 family outer membrane protein [candidate division WOR-3 bacterium]
MKVAVAALLIGSLVPAGPVEQIRFQGNRSFSSRLLLSVVQVRRGRPVTEALLDQDSRSLEWFYKTQGFMSVRVEKGVEVRQGKATVFFRITEGRRSRVQEIVITGNQEFATARLKKMLPYTAGDFFSADKITAGTQRLREFYLDHGYPLVQIAESLKIQDTLVKVEYQITAGPRCYIRAITVRGNRRVSTATILRTVEVRSGERFSRFRLEMAKRRLYATKLFSRALYYIQRADSSKSQDSVAPAYDSVNIRFDVVEQEQQGVGLGFGFETPPPRLLFSVDYEHNNFANRGQWLIAGVSGSPDLAGNYRLNLDLTYRIPYLLVQRIDFQTHPYFFFERLDSARLRDYGIETGMGRDLLPQLHLGIFNRLRLVADTGQGITNSLALNLILDTRDDFLEPHAGVYIQPVIEVAGGLFRGDNDFYRLRADCRFYQALGGFVIAARIAGGRVIPYGRSSGVPYYEEFSLGGSNNLRGYPERALGPDTAAGGRYGPVVINGNLELRSPYSFKWVGFAGFVDFGQVAGQRDIRLRGLEAGAGAGLRFRTPIGPVRLDWGKRLTSPPVGDRGRFYLGILHAF